MAHRIVVALALLVFAAPAAAQPISGITPSSADPGDAVTITLDVIDLTGITSVTIESFVTGFADNTNSAGTGTVDVGLEIPFATTPGDYDVVVTHDGGDATNTGGFTVNVPADPAINTATPNSAESATSLTVSLDVTRAYDITAVRVDSWVTGFTDNTTNGTGTVDVELDIPFAAAEGAVDIEVDFVGGTLTLADGFTIEASDASSIDTITPSSADPGTTPSIELAVTRAIDVTAVRIGTFATGFTDNTTGGDGTIEVDLDIPLAATAGGVDVEVDYAGGTLTVTDGFTVNALGGAVVDSVLPGELPRGRSTTVVVRGAGLDGIAGASLGGSDVQISGFVAESATRLRFQVQVSNQATLGQRDLVLTGDGGTTVMDAVEIVAGQPSVIFVDPNVGDRGDDFEVTIGGTNLDIVESFDLGAGITVTNWSASSPIRATADIDIGPAAPAGPHAATVTWVDGERSLAGAFTVTGAAPEVDTIAPASGVRGETLEVTIEGRNLDQVNSAQFGARVTVIDFEVVNPTRALATVEVRPDASAGPRNVTLRTDGEPIELAAAFEVVPGDLEVFSLRPDRIGQGAVESIVVEGLNLDGVDSFDAGDGVSVDFIDAEFPTRITVDVTVAADAAIGLRDVTVTGPNGSAELLDRLVVTEAVLPPLDLRFPEQLDLGDSQIGAWQRGGFLIENAGDLEEVVTIGDPVGDFDLISLIDDSGRRVEEVTVTIPPDSQATVMVQFAPTAATPNGAAFSVLARDEEAGTVSVRGRGVSSELMLLPEAPIVFDPISPDTETALPRVDTTLADGVLPRQTEVLGASLVLDQNNQPVDQPADFITFELINAAGGETNYWGDAEVQWSIEAPMGSYVGTLLFETDSESAPFVPFEFRIRATDDPGMGDVGVDAGPDVGMDAGMDATPDADPDTGMPDVGGPDTGNTDTGMPDTGNPDTVGDAGGDADDDGGSGGGGGCSATNSGRPAVPALCGLVLLGLLIRRR